MFFRHHDAAGENHTRADIRLKRMRGRKEEGKREWKKVTKNKGEGEDGGNSRQLCWPSCLSWRWALGWCQMA